MVTIINYILICELENVFFTLYNLTRYSYSKVLYTYSIFVDETIQIELYSVDHEGRGYKQMFLLKEKCVYIVILIIISQLHYMNFKCVLNIKGCE